MGFAEDIAKFKAKMAKRADDVYNRSVEAAFSSIVEGSPLTGAPGQPVDTGFLKGSWQLSERPTASTLSAFPSTRAARRQAQRAGTSGNLLVNPSEGSRVISTNAPYAPQIESGTRAGRALTLRSPVGGFHSVALTRAGWTRIVDAMNQQVPT